MVRQLISQVSLPGPWGLRHAVRRRAGSEDACLPALPGLLVCPAVPATRLAAECSVLRGLARPPPAFSFWDSATDHSQRAEFCHSLSRHWPGPLVGFWDVGPRWE